MDSKLKPGKQAWACYNHARKHAGASLCKSAWHAITGPLHQQCNTDHNDKASEAMLCAHSSNIKLQVRLQWVQMYAMAMPGVVTAAAPGERLGIRALTLADSIQG